MSLVMLLLHQIFWQWCILNHWRYEIIYLRGALCSIIKIIHSTENYNEELADLTSEISLKQKLIEGLEQSQRRLDTMRQQYEEKLNLLMNRIKATQDERDKVSFICGFKFI